MGKLLSYAVNANNISTFLKNYRLRDPFILYINVYITFLYRHVNNVLLWKLLFLANDLQKKKKRLAFKNMSRTMFTNFSYSVVNNSILESLIEDLMN